MACNYNVFDGYAYKCNYILPTVKNVTLARYKFFSRRQQCNESIDNFVAALKNLSLLCDLGHLRDELVKDIMICGLAETLTSLRDKLLAQNPTTLDEACFVANKELNYGNKREEIGDAEQQTEKSNGLPCSKPCKSTEFNADSLQIKEVEQGDKIQALGFPWKETKETGKTMQCSECDYSCTDKVTLKDHKKIHKVPEICKECGKSFKKINSLNRHMMSHSGERPFMCSECGKSFIRKGALDAHQSTHSKTRPFTCDHCGKSFASKLYLFVHIRIHTGDKPYQCQFCGKQFAQKSTFNVHVRTNHTKETPYHCQHCEKAFIYKRDLVYHDFSHTGENPFLCSECGKCFTQQSYLNIHKKIHSNERPYSCSKCDKSFKSKKSLSRHSIVHGDKKPKRAKINKVTICKFKGSRF